ncbi:MAG: hypothetical protein ABJE95_23545 [Byssovorax sp.]
MTDILRRALRLVEERRADAYAGMAGSLDGLSLAVSVSVSDCLVLRGAEGALREEPVEGRAAIRISTDRDSVRALLAGRMTLNESLRSGAIELAGTAEALGHGLRAFEFFVCALLRIDEAEQLRRELER